MSHDLIESDAVDVEILLGTEKWEVIEAEVVLSMRSTPDYVDMRITPSEGVDFPRRPQRDAGEFADGYLGEDFILNADTQLRADTPGPEVQRLFTGSISNITPLGDRSYEALAYGPTQDSLVGLGADDDTSFMNTTIDISKASDAIRTGSPGPAAFAEYGVAGDAKLMISDVLDLILSEAGIPEENRIINIRENGVPIGSTPDGRILHRGFDYEITFTTWKVPVKEALSRIESAARADWWFDRFGNFHFGPRVPDEDIYAYELRYITESSDGLTTPAYNSVKVIGDGYVSREGWEKSDILSDTGFTYQGEVSDIQDKDLAEPIFTYKNMQLNTAEEVRQVHNSIVDEIRSQQAEGTVTVVGFPELRPGDAIQMPDTQTQPMGGTRYGINKLTHRLNADDGFITKIEVGGPVGGQETVWTDKVEELEESINPLWNPSKKRAGDPLSDDSVSILSDGPTIDEVYGGSSFDVPDPEEQLAQRPGALEQETSNDE